MKTSLLALVAISTFAVGIAVAGVSGYGPLAYISYHIITQQQQSQGGQTQVIPAYINLGNITPDESGNATAKASVNISSSGYYTIELEHSDQLQEDFSKFVVYVNIDNYSIALSPENDTAHVYLAKGFYNVTILVVYQVAQNPQGDLTVIQEPLLVIHPTEQDEGSS
jgi:2,5-dioxopentanoate dehydrogenase